MISRMRTFRDGHLKRLQSLNIGETRVDRPPPAELRTPPTFDAELRLTRLRSEHILIYMNNRKAKRVLLSSVCQPWGVQYGDGFGTSYEATHQYMWAQGIFRPRETTAQWGIDLIAANLKTPTVTLHYPTMKRFVAELKRGYDYVGIAFVPATLP